jgi:hypothetical protein
LEPWGHHADGRPQEPGPQGDNPPAIGPAGTVHCSLTDYAAFLALHLRAGSGHPALLRPDTFRRLHGAEGGAGAMGWLSVQRNWAGGTALMHAGSNTMWYCVAWLAPAKGFAVAAATNQGGDAAERVCDDAAGLLTRGHGV